MLHLQPISYLAEVAAKADLSTTALRGLHIQLLADAAAATLRRWQALAELGMGHHWRGRLAVDMMHEFPFSYLK